MRYPRAAFVASAEERQSTTAHKKAIQRVINTAQKIIGHSLPSLEDLYSTRCLSRAYTIIKDSTHPGHWMFELLPLDCIYAAVVIINFILTLPLSAPVIHLFIFMFMFWKPNTNQIFLFNRVLADFLRLNCSKKSITSSRGEQRSISEIISKAMLFMLFLNGGASISFLTVQYNPNFHLLSPGRRNCVKVFKKSPQISVIIWILLLPLTIPTMVTTFECCNSHGRKNETYFHDVTDTFREIVFFSQIIIPYIILVYCTVCIVKRLRKKTVGERAKLRRAVWLVISIVVIFSICFLPCTIARAVLLYVQDVENTAVQVYDALMVLSYSDCLLDLMVYCFCNSGFKDIYISTVCPAFFQKRWINPDSGTKKTTYTTIAPGTRMISLPTPES
ncbi:12-(S)-hydroxy-5,8,10,14-eicosatetraenoic acid receptor-like [Archocentrus centrarchus]|uniref:12-(S)-hydroxy-5,8,10,14-eicosatetraenoic acid receptor-like n=1 Tax=Archocentrus centrarchus TaxID=63155 RepID=UPI0011EA26AF|nr:12-(S)-hydroxy-5,8,10,14-eicosatetraenoic acid receptor-like [Archocentrus centrarchus]